MSCDILPLRIQWRGMKDFEYKIGQSQETFDELYNQGYRIVNVYEAKNDEDGEVFGKYYGCVQWKVPFPTKYQVKKDRAFHCKNYRFDTQNGWNKVFENTKKFNRLQDLYDAPTP